MIITPQLIGIILAVALVITAIILFLSRKKMTGNPEHTNLLEKIAFGLFGVAFVIILAAAMTGLKGPAQETFATDHPPMDGQGSIGQINEAEVKDLEEKITKDPNDVGSRERLGHLYLQAQNYEGVFQMAHDALKLNPKSSESRAHMGMVLFAMQDAPQAMQQFEKSLQENPHHLETLLFKGIVELQGLNDAKAAEATWGTYLRIAPENDPARARVNAFLQMAKGESAQ
ncbi:MAG: hypothetical protein HY540_03315 [Deltaproteobacteria bacterium]|nr:hypothetical protein [Deltaproteobacteria bacterium]